jgi:hypothetical protein
MKTCPLQHEIDIATLENDLDALAEMLSLYEDDDELRYLLYEAIDIVTANLNLHPTARGDTMTPKAYEPLEPHGLFPTSVAAEAQKHITELRRYLAEHPNPSTHQSKQAKHDREVALARWLRLVNAERTGR